MICLMNLSGSDDNLQRLLIASGVQSAGSRMKRANSIDQCWYRQPLLLDISPRFSDRVYRARILARDGWGRASRPLTRLLDFLLGWLFRIFNWGFLKSSTVYSRLVGGLLRVPVIVLLVYVGLLGLTGWGYRQLPTGFIPSQDKGYLIASVQLPDASSAGRTREVISTLERIALAHPAVQNVNSVAGNSFILSAYGSNFGSMFIILKSFDERRQDQTLYADDVPGANLYRFRFTNVAGQPAYARNITPDTETSARQARPAAARFRKGRDGLWLMAALRLGVCQPL